MGLQFRPCLTLRSLAAKRTGGLAECFLHITREMRHVFKMHHVGHFGQRLRRVIEKRYQFEGRIILYPLRGRQAGDGAAHLRQILRCDAEQVGIVGHFALRPGILLSQSKEPQENPCGIVRGVHLGKAMLANRPQVVDEYLHHTSQYCGVAPQSCS